MVYCQSQHLNKNILPAFLEVPVSKPIFPGRYLHNLSKYEKQAEVQQCLAQHNVARLSLNCVYVVARVMVRL